VFFGTLVDVNRRSGYAPVESAKRLLRPCHYGVFGGDGGGGVRDGWDANIQLLRRMAGQPLQRSPRRARLASNAICPYQNPTGFVFAERGGLVRDYTELTRPTICLGPRIKNLLQKLGNYD